MHTCDSIGSYCTWPAVNVVQLMLRCQAICVDMVTVCVQSEWSVFRERKLVAPQFVVICCIMHIGNTNCTSESRFQGVETEQTASACKILLPVGQKVRHSDSSLCDKWNTKNPCKTC